jgi:hypothetical protein
VRKANVEMLESQLNHFIMYDDEMPYKIFNRLKKLVNKARVIGSKKLTNRMLVNKVSTLWSKKWTDRILTERVMMTYTPINYNVVALIHQNLNYKKITSDEP